MTVDPDVVSSADIAALLLRSETAAGIEAAAPAMSGWIKVERMVVRVGTPDAVTDSVDWEAELTVVTDDVDGSPPAAPPPTVPPIPEVIAGLPVGAIEGVSPKWSAALEGEAITTVGDLAGVDSDRAQALAAAHGRKLIPLIERARACRVSVRSAGDFGSVTLDELLTATTADLAEMVRDADAGVEARRAISILSAALRLSILDRIRLGDIEPPSALS